MSVANLPLLMASPLRLKCRMQPLAFVRFADGKSVLRLDGPSSNAATETSILHRVSLMCGSPPSAPGPAAAPLTLYLDHRRRGGAARGVNR